MGLSFLNPTSEKSGLTEPCNTDNSFLKFKFRRLERTVLQNFDVAFTEDLSLWEDLCLPFHLLMGSHYSDSPYEEKVSAKGLLDYLVFPLLARKLIFDTYLEERQESAVTNVLAWVVAGFLESLRFAIGLTLSVLFAPVMFIAHFVDLFFADEFLIDEDLTHKLKSS